MPIKTFVPLDKPEEEVPVQPVEAEGYQPKTFRPIKPDPPKPELSEVMRLSKELEFSPSMVVRNYGTLVADQVTWTPPSPTALRVQPR